MNKTAIITGASHGIGKACTLELAKHFDTLVINACHSSNALEELKHTLEKQGVNCLSYLGDIGDYAFVESMMQEVTTQYSNIDLLINNAGISYVGLLSDMTINQWNDVVTTNLTSVFNCCKNIIPYFVSKKSGHIINISSIWGMSGASCEVAYSATKGGVNSFTKALSKELAPSNIQVNAIACGAIDTRMNNCFSKEEMEAFCEEIPAGRMGTPQEVAQFVWQLYNSPSYLTGEVIKLDGGYL